MSKGPQQALSKHFYKFREGIDQLPAPFDEYSSEIQMQGHHMSVTRQSAAVQRIAPDPTYLTGAGPSFQCALLLCVASVSSFIGAALLLAAI
jgi:hypothetical protein